MIRIKVLKYLYEKKNGKPAPYYYEYSLLTIIKKPVRKWLTNTVAANCPFNFLRIWIYRLCGFNIGKHVFIGMKCYLDDMCYDLLTVGDHVTISYGVFFACHGKNQGHVPIRIEDGAYIGMRANIISNNADKAKTGVNIGRDAIIGASTLVNRDIPQGATAIGVPCRIIQKERMKEPD